MADSNYEGKEGTSTSVVGDAEKRINTPPAETEGDVKHSIRFYMAFLSLLVCTMLVSLELVMMSAVLSPVAEEFNANSNEVYWTGTGYILAQTVSMAIIGSLSEKLGRKVMLQASLAIFLLATILCSRAKSIQWLIATRVVQGIGGGGLTTLAGIVVVDMTTMRERAKFLSLLGAAYAIGNVGLVVGAAVGERSTWRWIFYLNIPLCVIGMVGVQLFVQISNDEDRSPSGLLKLDWAGYIVFAGALSSLLLGVTSGGTIYPWSSAKVIAPLVIGVAGLIPFILIELFVASSPMIPLEMFRDGNTNLANLGGFALGFSVSASAYYLVVYFTGAVGRSLITASADILPALLFVPFGSFVGGALLAKFKGFRIPVWIAWLFAVGGLGAYASLTPTSPRAQQEILQIISGIGMGMLFVILPMISQASQPDELSTVVMNTTIFFRALGQTFGIAICGTVFQNRFANSVSKLVKQGAIPQTFVISAQDAEGSATQVGQLPAQIVTIYRTVYAQSLQKVWYLVMAVVIVGLLCSLFIKARTLDRGLTSKQRFQEIPNGGNGVRVENSDSTTNV